MSSCNCFYHRVSSHPGENGIVTILTVAVVLLLVTNWVEFVVRAMCNSTTRKANAKAKEETNTKKDNRDADEKDVHIHEGWSFVNPHKITKPLAQWTLQECWDTTVAIGKRATTSLLAFVPTIDAATPRPRRREVLKTLRGVLTLTITTVWLSYYHLYVTLLYPAYKKWNMSTMEKNFWAAAEAYDTLMDASEAFRLDEWVARAQGQMASREDMVTYHIYLRTIPVLALVLLLVELLRHDKECKRGRLVGKDSPNKKWYRNNKTKWRIGLWLVIIVACAIPRMWLRWKAKQADRNPFVVLQMEPTTDLKAIKKAYRKVALRYHPD